MKKFYYFFTLFFIFTNNVFASNSDWWIFWNTSWNKLKNWDITLNDIPNFLVNMINFFIGIAFSISVVFIIIWAYKYLFGTLSQSTDKWKDTIKFALLWAALSSMSYFIIKFIIDNLL